MPVSMLAPLQIEDCFARNAVGGVGHQVHHPFMDLIAVGSESYEVPNESAGPRS